MKRGLLLSTVPLAAAVMVGQNKGPDEEGIVTVFVRLQSRGLHLSE